jgi:hypothetical protein
VVVAVVVTLRNRGVGIWLPSQLELLVKVMPVDLEAWAAAAVVVRAQKERLALHKEIEMVETVAMEFLIR